MLFPFDWKWAKIEKGFRGIDVFEAPREDDVTRYRLSVNRPHSEISLPLLKPVCSGDHARW